MATYLDRIIDDHRAAAAADPRPADELVEQARTMPATRGFRDALTARPGLSVIAEIKRRSPSKGVLANDIVPGDLAVKYQSGGAACLSVLTDERWFGGSVDDLQAARAACDLPVLRKDFTVDQRDVADARIMGADAVLLIAAALDDGELSGLHDLGVDLGLDVLVEVHDERELQRALDVGASLVGVNQRDLVTFEVDTDRAVRVAESIPAEVTSVAESGIRGPADAARLLGAGFDAVLVGEHLVTSGDPAGAVRALQRAGTEGVGACS